MKPHKHLDLILLIVIASALFAANQFVFSGTIESAESLGKELQSSSEQLHEWELSKKAPFKYRIIFPSIVQATHGWGMELGWLSNDDFYHVYLFISCLCLIFASISLYVLLKEVLKNINYVYIGMAAYFLSVPFLFAYTVPVHTREDFLAFGFFHLGLWALLRKNDWLFVTVAVLGVLTRETLMLLPFIRLFFGFGPLVRRMVFSAIPAISWLLLRWYLGAGSYDKWIGLNWNIRNLEQVLAFGFLSFSFLWIPAILAYNRKLSRFFISQKAFKVFGRKAFLSCLFLVMATTFVFGIFNEIRLLFLLAPFILVYAVSYYQQYKAQLSKFWSFRSSKILLVALIIVVLFASYFSTEMAQFFFPFNKYGIAYPLWFVVLLIYSLPSIFLVAFEIYRNRQVI